MIAYLMSIDDLNEASFRKVRKTAPERLKEAGRFPHEERRLQSVAAGVLLSDIMHADEEKIQTGPHGKPYLEGGKAFNLAHSGKYALLAVAEKESGEVGADLEYYRKPDRALAERISTPEELAWIFELPIVSTVRFTKLWTVKESVLKCRGTGLSESAKEVNALPVLLESGPAEAFGKSYDVRVETYDDAVLAVASETPMKRFRLRRYREAGARFKSFIFGLIQWTWGLPQNLLGLLITLVLKLRKKFSMTYRTALATRWDSGGSMSLGRYLFIGPHSKDERDRLYGHEYGHTIQSLILGPLYLFVIGLPSFIRANLPPFNRNWRSGKTDYYDFYPERWANALGIREKKEKTPENYA